VEEWFYISLPILILVLSRIFSVKKTIFVAISILLLLPLLYRISISDLKVDQFWWGVEFRKVVLTRLDAINYGVLGAFGKYYYPTFWFKCRKWAFGLGLIFLYIAILLPKDYNGLFFKTVYFNIIAIGAMLLLPLADSIKTYKNRHIGNFFTFFSKISYSLYLINLGIVITLITTNFKLITNFQHVVAYGSYWLIVVVLAWIIYTYFENPIMKLRDKF
jgi:peptidoglycan/LPS O-acetylase OafA/YrhL